MFEFSKTSFHWEGRSFVFTGEILLITPRALITSRLFWADFTLGFERSIWFPHGRQPSFQKRKQINFN